VSVQDDLEKALLITGFPYDLREHLGGHIEIFGAFLSRARAIRRDGSAALDLCYVAAGRADGFWEANLAPWDTAAGALLVTESGGKVSDYAGAPWDPRRNQILASNPALHQPMVGVLRAFTSR
jgi:myo-inositol-1(or 4)-monophosphatase